MGSREEALAVRVQKSDECMTSFPHLPNVQMYVRLWNVECSQTHVIHIRKHQHVDVLSLAVLCKRRRSGTPQLVLSVEATRP